MHRLSFTLVLAMTSIFFGCSCDSDEEPTGTGIGDGGPDVTVLTDGGGGGGNDGGTCEQLTVGSEQAAPEVLIVLDQSLSMNDEGRWPAAVQAVGAVAVNLDTRVAFGLAAFGNRGQPRACSSVEVVIPPAVGAAAEISDYLENNRPRGGTPIAAMLNRISRLKAGETLDRIDGLPELATVILMTDGAPNCNAALDSDNCTCTLNNNCSRNDNPTLCLDDTDAIAAVETLAAQGVSTYIVGYSVSEWETTLNAMAAAGTPGGAYFPVENATELESSLGGIASGISTCSFELDKAPPNLTFVRVTLNDDEVPHTSQVDDGSGWSLDGTSVQLLGSHCDTAKNDPDALLDIKVECQEVFVLR